MEEPARLKPDDLEIRNFSADLEAGIVGILQTSFGEKWGDRDYWRWKHASRPGFVPADVVVFTDAGRPTACFHLSVRSLRLGPGLEFSCSFEGDFATEPRSRGAGLAQRAYLHSARHLVDRSVVLRAGFSTPELYERLYKPRFGHRMMPTVTSAYRKILSDEALRTKLREFGNELRSRPAWRRIAGRRAVAVRIAVNGFQPCTLSIAPESCSCTGDVAARADLTVTVPYRLLAAARMRRSHAMFAVARALLAGQLRIRGLLRFVFDRTGC
jgi:hypothetical protein